MTRSYPRHLVPRRSLFGRIADLLMPHSMAFLGQGVDLPPQRSHVRIITPEMVIERACAEAVEQQRAARR